MPRMVLSINLKADAADFTEFPDPGSKLHIHKNYIYQSYHNVVSMWEWYRKSLVTVWDTQVYTGICYLGTYHVVLHKVLPVWLTWPGNHAFSAFALKEISTSLRSSASASDSSRTRKAEKAWVLNLVGGWPPSQGEYRALWESGNPPLMSGRLLNGYDNPCLQVLFVFIVLGPVYMDKSWPGHPRKPIVTVGELYSVIHYLILPAPPPPSVPSSLLHPFLASK